MSGGVAYILDTEGDFATYRCNPEMVDLENVETAEDIETLRTMIENHQRHTGSTVAEKVLANWDAFLPKFVKVMPRDFKIALERLAREKEDVARHAHAEAVQLAEKQE